MKQTSAIAAALLLSAAASYASVNATIEAFGLYDASFNPVAADTWFLIAVDTEQDGFDNLLFADFSLDGSAGSLLGGSDDDRVLMTGQVSSVRGTLKATGSGIILYDGNDVGAITGVGEGDPFGIYWFPGLTESSATLSAGQTVGAFLGYSSSTVAPPVNSSDWILPPNNQQPRYFYESTLTGGDGPDNATFTVTVVPEPSAVGALFGLAALLFARRRF